jgi:alanyl-tRNA synthetase
MTERLYYADSYLARFTARVLETDESGRRAVLDRTSFYPTSGGQPHDLGTLNGLALLEVIDDGDKVIHVLDGRVEVGSEVAGEIDWPRRHDHMQQHSGQHLLSAVFEELFGCQTLSFHLGTAASTIDISAVALDAAQLLAAEERANALVCDNRPLAVSFEDAAQVQGLRKETGRAGILRIVSIEGCDRSACGGTHVRATGEIGPILLRKVEKIRGSVRVEFLCGMRAVRRSREEFSALSAVARLFSAPAEETPGLVAALQEQVRESEKSRRKLALEAAGYRGRALYQEAAAGARGRRSHLDRRAAGALDEEVRAVAAGFCSQSNAVFIAATEDPPSLLVTASSDAGLHAGNVLKELLAASGGRGGGSALSAQGSVPSVEALDTVLARLAHL